MSATASLALLRPARGGEIAPVAAVAPIVRGACSRKDDKIEGAWRRLVWNFAPERLCLSVLQSRLAASQRRRRGDTGSHHPDQELATGTCRMPKTANSTISRDAHEKPSSSFVTRYRDYFARHNQRAGGSKQELDPLPRVVLVPGLGLFGLGPSKQDAVIAADIAEEWMAVVHDAERIGRFESISEADMFDCRVLAARTEKARHAQGAATRRTDRRRSPAPPARSAPRPRRPSLPPARKSPCST